MTTVHDSCQPETAELPPSPPSDPLEMIATFPDRIKFKILDLLVNSPRIIGVRNSVRLDAAGSHETAELRLSYTETWSPEAQWKKDARKQYFQHNEAGRQEVFGMAVSQLSYETFKETLLFEVNQDFISPKDDILYISDLEFDMGDADGRLRISTFQMANWRLIFFQHAA